MSAALRPHRGAGVVSRPMAGLKFDDPAGVLNYNAAHTVMSWVTGFPANGSDVRGGFHAIVRPVSGGYSTYSSLLTWHPTSPAYMAHSAMDDSNAWEWSSAGVALTNGDNPASPLYPWKAYWWQPSWSPQQQLDPLFSTYPYANLSAWTHVAIVRTGFGPGHTETLYYNGVADVTRTLDPLSVWWWFTNNGGVSRTATPTRFVFGSSGIGTNSGGADAVPGLWNSMNGKFAYARAFATALTAEQIQIEMQYTAAGAQGGGGVAWGDWPLEADYNDVSGNGRHLSELNTLAERTAIFGATIASEFYAFDADLPSGLLDPAPPVVGSLRGTTGAFPQLAGLASASPQLVASTDAFPQLTGTPRGYIMPE